MAGADRMMDEVTLLEAALREAVARRDNGASSPASSPTKELHKEILKEQVKYGMEARGYASTATSPNAGVFRERFNDAVAVYGVQLKGWIDMQVDARLNLVLRDALARELMAWRQENAATIAGVQQAEADMEVLKGTQAKLLAVVEGISEELARTKAAVSALQLGTQLDMTAMSKREVDFQDATKDELKKWVEESQTRLSEDILALQQRLMTELRNETTAAFRSEAAAVAALDEQLWLTDQRLGQRIDELAHAQRDSITVVERRKGGDVENVSSVQRSLSLGVASPTVSAALPPARLIAQSQPTYLTSPTAVSQRALVTEYMPNTVVSSAPVTQGPILAQPATRGVTEIDKVNTLGQVVERDFVAGISERVGGTRELVKEESIRIRPPVVANIGSGTAPSVLAGRSLETYSGGMLAGSGRFRLAAQLASQPQGISSGQTELLLTDETPMGT